MGFITTLVRDHGVRRDIETQLSEKSVCTANTVLPLHVIESTLEGGEQEEAEITLTTEIRGPTPFVAGDRVPAD
jgi:hypothetical protein